MRDYFRKLSDLELAKKEQRFKIQTKNTYNLIELSSES